MACLWGSQVIKHIRESRITEVDEFSEGNRWEVSCTREYNTNSEKRTEIQRNFHKTTIENCELMEEITQKYFIL